MTYDDMWITLMRDVCKYNVMYNDMVDIHYDIRYMMYSSVANDIYDSMHSVDVLDWYTIDIHYSIDRLMYCSMYSWYV